jgi:hypothetical protein
LALPLAETLCRAARCHNGASPGLAPLTTPYRDFRLCVPRQPPTPGTMLRKLGVMRKEYAQGQEQGQENDRV